MAVEKIQGSESAKGFKIAVVVSRFNAFVTDRLLEGALEALKKEGAQDADVLVLKVPGAWEIPFAARQIAPKVDAIVALGAVIRGETAHFEYVSNEAIRGIADVMAETGVPISLGILTTEDEKQAEARADKGMEAALAALEMANLRKTVRGRG
jgi:6,7-dimethyl-8-ribityllumazine synthase